ncbi:replication protein O [Acinetobacter phage Ab69]|nr:replication protein O [Acinetobacter phage Ab69]
MSDYLEQPKQVTEQKTNDFEWADFNDYKLTFDTV